MKRILFLVVLMGVSILVSASPVMAQAGVPVTWTFTELTVMNGQQFHWTSPTAVDPTFSRYDYVYNITKAEGYVGIWLDVTDMVPDGMDTGSGFHEGAPPFTIMSEAFDVTESGVTVQAFLNASVDENGFAHLDMTGNADGTGGVTISGLASGLRMSGNVTVTPTPEPATMGLLGIGGLALIRRRRKTA
ncbi:MAG: PEP-CTERM sorting domain-containing protein [Phycisphaerae bacterium]|nr:PEP-CTERM sorting domain-containing protein [Phycisphaerae bacterium]